MTSEPEQRARFELRDSERRWLNALLILGTIVVSLVLLGLVAQILLFFSDILLVFLLSWLLAFMISPLVAAVLRTFPTLPRTLVVVLIYLVLFFAVSGVTLTVAASLATSIAGFVRELPTLQGRLPTILAPWEATLAGLGLQVDLVAAARQGLEGLSSLGNSLVAPLTDLALASVGMLGNLLLIVFLSLFIVMDRDDIVVFLNRLVPPRYAEEARLFETSVSRSFGGFLRGQAIQGLVYGVIAALTHVVLGLDFLAASAALVGILQMIPFFGPFFSWAPPVLVAVLTRPDAAIPTIIVMVIGWFIVMNIIQPRVMASAVGIHPVVVLGSVLVGLKLAGIAGAVFSVPFAAVISSFFFYYLNRTAGGPRDVTSRAARRLEQREGHRIRIPTPPSIGSGSPEPGGEVPPTENDRPPEPPDGAGEARRAVADASGPSVA